MSPPLPRRRSRRWKSYGPSQSSKDTRKAHPTSQTTQGTAETEGMKTELDKMFAQLQERIKEFDLLSSSMLHVIKTLEAVTAAYRPPQTPSTSTQPKTTWILKLFTTIRKENKGER